MVVKKIRQQSTNPLALILGAIWVLFYGCAPSFGHVHRTLPSQQLGTIRVVAGITLDPPIYFQKGSVLLCRRVGRFASVPGVEFINYKASSPRASEDAYSWYRRVYSRASGRWRGEQFMQPSGTRFLAFSVHTSQPANWLTYQVWSSPADDPGHCSPIPRALIDKPVVSVTVRLPTTHVKH